MQRNNPWWCISQKRIFWGWSHSWSSLRDPPSSRESNSCRRPPIRRPITFWLGRHQIVTCWETILPSNPLFSKPSSKAAVKLVALIMISSGLNNYGYAWEMMAHFSKKSGHKDSGVLAWGQKWALVVTITNDDNADRLALLLSLSNRQRLRNSKGGQFDKDLINCSSHDP